MSTLTPISAPSRLEAAAFCESVSVYLDEIRGSRLAPGVDGIRIPGERSHQTRRDSAQNGVVILEESWHRLAAHAERLDVEVPD